MKVLAAMSGGVDSSVAAALLADEGHEVWGATMKLFSYSMLAGEGAVSACCSLDDAEDAKAACRKLGIPHYMLNFTRRFEADVIVPFCEGYLRGETPNPCIDCNRALKFAGLQQRRRELGLDAVATGHYARIGRDEASGRWLLRRGLDASKDQSYVLYQLTQDDLAHLLLPLGELTKQEVRALAAERGLGTAQKPESQDICFAPDGDYAAFIEHYATERAQAPLDLEPLEPGPILDGSGRVLGQHSGIARYTIGQRKGLGIAAGEPLYVREKDAAANALVVGTAEELLTRRVEARDANLIAVERLEGPHRVGAKTHYRQEPVPAVATQEGDRLVVELDEPQRAAAPGQALVLYDGDIVIGGGTIV